MSATQNHIVMEVSSDESSASKEDCNTSILRRGSNQSGASAAHNPNFRSEDKPSFSSIIDNRGRKGFIPLFFERASGNVLNPCFDSSTLEEEFQEFSVKIDKRLFQMALLYLTFACFALTVYFGVSHVNRKSHVPLTAGCAAGCVISLLYFILTTFSVIYHKPWQARLTTVTFAVIFAAGEVLSFELLKEADFAYSSRFIVFTTLVIIIYTMLPALPVYGNIIINVIFSFCHELFACYLSNTKGEKKTADVFAIIILHLCVHIIGITIVFMAHVRKRSTFWRVGQSVVAKQDLNIEQRVKNRMIRSVMPKKVAEFLIEDGLRQKRVGTIKQRRVAFRPFIMNQLENVSILFADIVGFTKMSANKKADTLVNLLNILFGKFDELTIVNNNEKISTLGDCYYCVAGCPEPTMEHAIASVEMGLDICEQIKKFREETGEEVDMRVGIHTGVVLCGIVGDRRRRFDVWSNDVSLANKMEASGKPGRVHITEVTASFLNDMYDLEEGPGIQRLEKDKDHKEVYTKLRTMFIESRKYDTSMYKTWQKNMPPERFDGSLTSINEAVEKEHSGSLGNVLDGLGSETKKKLKNVKVSQSPVHDNEINISMNSIHRKEVTLADDQVEKDFLQKTTVSPPMSPNGPASHLQKHLTKTPLPYPRFSATFNFTYGMTLNEALMRDALRASNDNQLVKLMHGKKVQKEYFFNPPLQFLSLRFKDNDHDSKMTVDLSKNDIRQKHSPSLEQQYREDCFKGFKLNPQVTTFASPKVHFLFDIIVVALTLILMVIATLLFFREPIPFGLIIFTPLCLLIMFTVLLVQCIRFSPHNFPPQISNCAHPSLDERENSYTFSVDEHVSMDDANAHSMNSKLNQGHYNSFKQMLLTPWILKHILGAIVLCLPISIAFSVYQNCQEYERCESGITLSPNYTHCGEVKKWSEASTEHFCLLVVVALLHFSIFTQLAALMKSAIIILWCMAFILILLVKPQRNCIWFYQENNATLNKDPYSFMIKDNSMIIVLQMLLVMLLSWRFEKGVRANYYGDKEAAEQKNFAIEQKQVADWLIQDMFPKHVSESLKSHKHCSKNYEMVGVLFATIVNFHEFYEENYEGGLECIRVLHELVADFDKELSKLADVEKIKTVYGTTFMAASGLNNRPPVVQINDQGKISKKHKYEHLKTLVEFALALQDALNEFNKNMLGFKFHLRCGYNAGPVTAGVIGSIKPQYDIWGDTVNLASRMDSTGVIDRIQVSEECMLKLRDFFTFEMRGTIYVKGKDYVKTYLLTGRLPNDNEKS